MKTKNNKYIAVLVVFISILPCCIQAQLNAAEKSALLNYMNKEFFVKTGEDQYHDIYSRKLQDKLVNDPANTAILKNCAIQARQLEVLHDAWIADKGNFETVDKGYEIISKNFNPGYTKKLYPHFSKIELESLKSQNAKTAFLLKDEQWYYTVPLNLKYLDLQREFIKKRNENFSKENSFTTLSFTHPELIDELKTDLANTFGKKITNDKLMEQMMTGWLENAYWDQIVTNSSRMIDDDTKLVEQGLQPCKNMIAQKLNEMAGKEDNNLPGKWNGVYTNGNVLVTLSGNAANGTYKNDGFTNTFQWSLDKVEGNTASGIWTETYEDGEKKGNRSGTVKVSVSGNSLSFDVEEDTPSFTYKSNGAAVPPGASSMAKGSKWHGSLYKKN